MSTKEQLQERKEAQEQLRKILKPGQTVYTTVLHTSVSGKTNHITVLIVEAGEIREISYLVAKALGERIAPKGGIKTTNGASSLVHHLGYTLFKAGLTLNHRSL